MYDYEDGRFTDVLAIVMFVTSVVWVIGGFTIEDKIPRGTPEFDLAIRVLNILFLIIVAGGLIYLTLSAIDNLRDEHRVGILKGGKRPERYRLPYTDYPSLLAVMSEGLEADGFELLATVPADPDMAWYSRRWGDDTEIIQIIRRSDFSQAARTTQNERFEAAFSTRYPQIGANRVFLVTCYCVNRVTDDFRKMVGMGDMWDKRRYELPAGISFDTRIGYIAKSRKPVTDKYVERYRRMLLRYWGLIREVSASGMYELEVWWAYNWEKKAFGHEIRIYSMGRRKAKLIHKEVMDEVTPIVWETNDSVRVGQKHFTLSHRKRVVVQDAGLSDEAE